MIKGLILRRMLASLIGVLIAMWRAGGFAAMHPTATIAHCR